jgi:hypothetical protein
MIMDVPLAGMMIATLRGNYFKCKLTWSNRKGLALNAKYKSLLLGS